MYSLSGILLLTFFVFVLFSVLVLIGDEYRDQTMPKAKQGVFDISKVNFFRQKSLPLDGEWSFYWQELLTPKQIDKLNSFSMHLNVPGTWNNQSIADKTTTNQGAGTYSLKVKLDQKYERLAIFVPSISSAYKLFVDDRLLSEGGTVSLTSEESVAAYQPGIFDFSPSDKQFTITLQISNHELHWGGPWESLRLGRPAELYKQQTEKNFRASFSVAMFITICIFNLIQFSLYPRKRTPLLLALISFALAFRELESSLILQLGNIYFFDFETGIKINFLTFTAASPIYLLYFYDAFPKEYNKKLVNFINSISIVYSLIILFSTAKFYSPLMPYYQLLNLVIIFYFVAGIFLAVLRKRKNANLLFIGSTILFAFIIHDILDSMQIIDSVTLSSFGLVTFLMCQNYLSYTYYINVGQEKKRLDIALKERNETLEHLSSSLEVEVEKRTKQLEKANKKLENLVNEDPLTCLLNRRGLMQYIDKADQALKNSKTPFCLLLIDFDHFKRLNDKLGHDVGDIVLETGGLVMKEIVDTKGYVGRWGGEEFLIVLNNMSFDKAYKVAEEVRKIVFIDLTAQIKHTVTITIGLTECSIDESIAQCIKRADQALYQGKSNGRNQVFVDKKS